MGLGADGPGPGLFRAATGSRSAGRLDDRVPRLGPTALGKFLDLEQPIRVGDTGRAQHGGYVGQAGAGERNRGVRVVDVEPVQCGRQQRQVLRGRDLHLVDGDQDTAGGTVAAHLVREGGQRLGQCLRVDLTQRLLLVVQSHPGADSHRAERRAGNMLERGQDGSISHGIGEAGPFSVDGAPFGLDRRRKPGLNKRS